jgi:hypothetical protein
MGRSNEDSSIRENRRRKDLKKKKTYCGQSKYRRKRDYQEESRSRKTGP